MTKKKSEKQIMSVNYNEATVINPSFLFIVHNDIEFNEMLSNLEPLVEYDCIIKVVLDDQPYYIGQFGAQPIVLVKTSDMGNTKPFASLNTTTIALSHWQPNYIIMLGVMAGFKEDMKIGDVIIARESIDYQSYKIKELEYISRAHYYYSGTLYKLFDNIQEKSFNELSGHKIFKGKVLSGDALIDSAIFKKAFLLTQYPEAMGAEMEFMGVASACISAGIANILMIKGVCDFGENKGENKETNQKLAMQNAIKLCKVVFNDINNFDKRKLKYSYSSIINKSVLISGSHDSRINQAADLEVDTEKSVDCKVAKTFAMELAMKLHQKGFRIVTGYGKEIGEAVVAGVLSNINIHNASYNLLNEHILMIPFPRIRDINYNGYDHNQFKSKYREIICKEARFAISIFGIKINENSIPLITEKASGVEEELMIAHNLGRTIIPVGATGFMSREIWNKVRENLDRFYPINSFDINNERVEKRRKCFEKLGQSIDFENPNDRNNLIDTIIEFISKPWEKA